MDRLTEWRNGHGALVRGDGYTKLARYEDLGLEPEEIHELLHQSYGPLHQKISRWIEADSIGRLVTIIDHIQRGTKMYWVWDDEVIPVRVDDITLWFASRVKVIYCLVTLKEKAAEGGVYSIGTSRAFHEEDVGKHIFYTEEDAIAELKRRKNEDCKTQK